MGERLLENPYGDLGCVTRKCGAVPKPHDSSTHRRPSKILELGAEEPTLIHLTYLPFVLAVISTLICLAL